MTQIPRVKLTLNKYMTTWEGKVLRYLHDSHPSKKSAGNMVMELSLAAWLPYVMRNEGASEAECREAASYSARFLLSQACAIANEFDLPKVEMQGLLGGSSVSVTDNVTYSEQTDVEEQDEEEEDDIMVSFPSLDAGFRT
ncbi:MAG: hypothetical protein HC815_05695 [Richelia sp. RM1_1_1]|nr:hypothetical protein [Richelia sp. RM1_1_1]